MTTRLNAYIETTWVAVVYSLILSIFSLTSPALAAGDGEKGVEAATEQFYSANILDL